MPYKRCFFSQSFGHNGPHCSLSTAKNPSLLWPINSTNIIKTVSKIVNIFRCTHVPCMKNRETSFVTTFILQELHCA